MTNQEFEEAYKKLNKEQREAVDTIDGPVMVVAGPGTGKTQILTLRIGNILQKTDGLVDVDVMADDGCHSCRRTRDGPLRSGSPRAT